MDRREVEDLIIGLLAEDAGKNPADLRDELADLGEWLPIDSLLAAEVLARVEAHYGIAFPATAEAAKNLRSVSSFAQAILDLARQQQTGVADTA
jgi:acyl carrier protein